MIVRSAVVFTCLGIIKNCLSFLDLPEGSDCETKDRHFTFAAKCVNANICPSLLYDIYAKKNINPICSFQGKTPIVCCDSCEFRNVTDAVIVPTGALYWKNGNKPWDKCLEYSQNAASRCAHEKQYTRLNRNTVRNCSELNVIGYTAWGGRAACTYEFPHMALLGYGEKLKDAQWQCGGSLISERFILTAGHCLFSSALREKVSFAALGILRRSDPASAWQTYRVSIISHPDYAPPAKYHDIALLKTDRQVVFSEAVYPACLSEEEWQRNEFVATGWGDIGRDIKSADTLQVVTLKAFNVSECRRQYPVHRHLLRGFDNDTQLCAGDMERPADTCGGDSGGPLQFDMIDKLCMYVVTGVTSAGHQCGDVGTAGIYTRVRPYLPWIIDTVWP